MNSLTYEIKSDKFSGPLSKLLELIEERKLEITAINLGEVTADFLKYLETREEEYRQNPGFLADFIWVASKLILIKSKAILPNLEVTSEEEAEIKELEERLKVYREFVRAKARIRNLYSTTEQSFSRRYLPPSFFFPPKHLEISELQAIIQRIFQNFQLVAEIPSAKINLLNFEAKLKELINRLKKEVQSSFRELSKDKSKEEIVVLFLAILYLLKENLIAFEQDKHFSDIVITYQKTHGKK